jgi:3D (Asp-Asp-Asp) domain-containing protein
MKKLYTPLLLVITAILFSGCSVLPWQVTLKKTKQQDFTIENKKYSMQVTATAYTSTRSQTDKTPYLAAWNNRLRPGIKSIAVSRDLLDLGLSNGTKVHIEGLTGTYKVLDKMNKRWTKKIDIYMGRNLRKAKRWGKRKVTIHWKKKTIVPLKGEKQTPYVYKRSKNKRKKS